MNKPCTEVTAVIVYQDSMPWFDVLLESFFVYKNDHADLRFILVQNQPCRDKSPQAADSFMAKSPWPVKRILTDPPPCADGRAHAHGLHLAFPLIETEWTLFLDADAGPLRHGWLDTMLDCNADIVGSIPESGQNRYDLPTLHPCMLLFRTKLGKPPYSDGYFGMWEGDQTPDKSNMWDVCRPFSYTVGIRPDVKMVRYPTHEMWTDGVQWWMIDDFGYHIRSISKRWARGCHVIEDGQFRNAPGSSRVVLTRTVQQLTWYTKPIDEDVE